MTTYNPFDGIQPVQWTIPPVKPTKPTQTDSTDVTLGFEPTTLWYVVVALYISMVILCLLVNLFFSLILLNGMESYKRPFYRIVWQLVFANLLSVIGNSGSTIPVSILLIINGKTDYPSSDYYFIFVLIDNIGDQLVIFSTFLIALHRFFVFVLPNIADKLFSGSKYNSIILMVWFLAIGITVFLFINKCGYDLPNDVYEQTKFQYRCRAFEMKYSKHDPTTEKIEKLLLAEVIGFPIFNLFLYIVIFFEIARKRAGRTSLKSEEIEILRQALLLFLAFEFSTAVSYTSLYVTLQRREVILVRRIINTVELLAGTMTPLLFFVTSREIRNGAKRLILCKKTPPQKKLFFHKEPSSSKDLKQNNANKKSNSIS